jgi:hypothetical protein
MDWNVVLQIDLGKHSLRRLKNKVYISKDFQKYLKYSMKNGIGT